jgi:hypothetical protein
MGFITIKPVNPLIGSVSQSSHRFTRRSDFLNYAPTLQNTDDTSYRRWDLGT